MLRAAVPDLRKAMFGVAGLAMLAALVGTGTARAESVYTTLDLDTCDILETYEDGGYDAQCPGYEGIPVFVSEGDARVEVDYGRRNEAFESFSAFNSAGETVEWYLGDNGPSAAILRFLIDVDGRSAQALVVSSIGSDASPGCVVGVVDGSEDQANGIARGIAAMAHHFDCTSDLAAVIAASDSLVSDFNAANR